MDRSKPIIDDSGDEEMQIDSSLLKNTKENDALEEMFEKDHKFFDKLLKSVYSFIKNF